MRLSFPVSTENGYLNSWSKAQHSIWNAVWDRKQAPQSKEQVFHHYSLFPVSPHTAIINYGTLKCHFPTLSEGLVIFDSSSRAASNSDLLELNKQKSEAFPHSSLFFCVLSLLSAHNALFILRLRIINLLSYYSNRNCKLQFWSAVLKRLDLLIFEID